MKREQADDCVAAERARWDARHAQAEGFAAPSEFVALHARRLAAAGAHAAQGLRALDLAAGGGRHARLLAALGYRVVALDFSRVALKRLVRAEPAVRAVCADAMLLPLRRGGFDLIVQTCFLERTILPTLAALLARGGTLLLETFLVDQFERSGHPRREFCLERGELKRLCAAPEVRLAVEVLHESPAASPVGATFLASLAARKS
jgi:SAM-dependent methyltransferase